MTNFDRAFDVLLCHEGGYVNNPADPGGETNWGITVAVARENGYSGAMRDMPVDAAKSIYRKRYWLAEFDQLAYPVAFAMFDAAVNSGVGQSVRWLQRAVGTADDGKLGPITMGKALQADPLDLAMKLAGHRLQFMTQLSTWATFGRGWARRIASNLMAGK